MNTFLLSTKSLIITCQGWYMKSAHYFYKALLEPRSENEDDKRTERILTFILLCFSIANAYFESVIIYLHIKDAENYNGIPLLFFTIIFLVFLTLYILTRKGYHRIIGYIFITLLFICISYSSYKWGASLPMGLLAYGLVVTMASIIIDSRFGFITALLACIIIIGAGLHEHSIGLVPQWRQIVIEKRDVYGYGIMIGLTALLSRLSNREMEKSLKRARASELSLKEERDNLEIIVEARTKALRESERERMRELYRFAEFGKLSGGIFHDLLNPLTAVSLSISALSKNEQTAGDNAEAEKSLKTAVQATKRMEQFMSTIRKQIKSNDMRVTFSLNEEIEDAIELITFKAKKAGVVIMFEAAKKYSLYGNPLKYNQVITNLLVNAIDALDALSDQIVDRKEVTISLSEEGENIHCSVSDNGPGIPEDVLPKIFTPFFTTKEKGISLGLSTTKDIVEEHFQGHITCKSTGTSGTIFTISLPTIHHEEKNPADTKENSAQHTKSLELS